MKTKIKAKGPIVPEYPKVYESFIEPWGLDINRQQEPFCFNSNVGVRRYTITVDVVAEPVDVICERLEQLWLKCDNHHHWILLQNEAKKYGYSFKGERGSLAPKRK